MDCILREKYREMEGGGIKGNREGEKDTMRKGGREDQKEGRKLYNENQRGRKYREGEQRENTHTAHPYTLLFPDLS